MTPTTTPDLSIVIPVYNAAPFLDTLLASFLATTGDKDCCELIAVNDASTDDSAKILTRWMTSRQLPLQVLTTPGLGPGPAREFGAQAARSSWVALVDADERFSPGWLTAALEFVQNPGQAVGCEGIVEVCDRHQVSLFTHQTQSLKPGRYLTANLILKRSLIQFCPRYRRGRFREDSDLAFQLLNSGHTIRHNPDLLVYHPPLPSAWWRPLSLARRYQYDGLLARRFPQHYWRDMDVHCLKGVSIPHLRLLIFGLCLGFQLGALGMVVSSGFETTSLVWSGLLLLGSAMLALAPIFAYLPLRQLRWQQVPVALMVYAIVPWVAIVSWLYGFWHFRHESPFQAEGLRKSATS